MLATKRLQKESLALAKDPPPGIRAKPAEDNILNFHYVVEGSSDTPYFGGHYHGVLKFPTEYPLKCVSICRGVLGIPRAAPSTAQPSSLPLHIFALWLCLRRPPSVMMYTPNGRFTTGQRLCMSMSDYHPGECLAWRTGRHRSTHCNLAMHPTWSILTTLNSPPLFACCRELEPGVVSIHNPRGPAVVHEPERAHRGVDRDDRRAEARVRGGISQVERGQLQGVPQALPGARGTAGGANQGGVF